MDSQKTHNSPNIKVIANAYTSKLTQTQTYKFELTQTYTYTNTLKHTRHLNIELRSVFDK